MKVIELEVKKGSVEEMARRVRIEFCAELEDVRVVDQDAEPEGEDPKDVELEKLRKKVGTLEAELEELEDKVEKMNDIDETVRHVGQELSRLSNFRDLGCPLRELRDELERALDEDLRTTTFHPDDVLARRGRRAG